MQQKQATPYRIQRQPRCSDRGVDNPHALHWLVWTSRSRPRISKRSVLSRRRSIIARLIPDKRQASESLVYMYKGNPECLGWDAITMSC